MASTKDVLLKDGRVIIRVTTDTDIGPQDKVIKDHLASAPFDVPNVGRIGILQQPGGAGIAWMTPKPM